MAPIDFRSILAITGTILFVDTLPSHHLTAGSIDSSSRIVGGEKVGTNEFPWLIYLDEFHPGSYTPMTGSLITSRCILLSQDIRMLFQTTHYNAVLGSSDRTDTNALKYIDLRNFTTHPYQGSDSFSARIIILPENITFSDTIFPIRVPKKDEIVDQHLGDNVVVAGWGKTSNGGTNDPVIDAFKMNTTVISKDDCISSFPISNDRITNNTMCTDGRDGKGACSYDEGAPMNFFDEKDQKWTVIGMVAEYYRNCELGSPTIYYNLAGNPSVLDWIEKNCGPTGNQQTPTFQCPSSSGIFANPDDCKGFYQCVQGNPTSYTCPGDLVFNPSLGVCDFPEYVPECVQNKSENV